MDGWRFCPRCGTRLIERELGGLRRQACADGHCGFVRWNNPAPVVAALVDYEGKVVLARNRAWPEKMFGLVTGFLERDESPEQAAAREVKEELNLEALKVQLIGNYAFPRRHEIILAYQVVAAGEIALNEELAEYRLIAPEKLRPWSFGTGLAIADWLRSRGIDPVVVPGKELD